MVSKILMATLLQFNYYQYELDQNNFLSGSEI